MWPSSDAVFADSCNATVDSRLLITTLVGAGLLADWLVYCCQVISERSASAHANRTCSFWDVIDLRSGHVMCWFCCSSFGVSPIAARTWRAMLIIRLLFGYLRSFWSLFVLAFIKTLNLSAGDLTLSGARTSSVGRYCCSWIFAIDNVAETSAGTFGPLLTGLPNFIAVRLDVGPTWASMCIRCYAAIALVVAVLYRRFCR